jgi:hypothetical protein
MARFETLKICGAAAEREELRDDLGIHERGRELEVPLPGKRRIPVLADDPGDCFFIGTSSLFGCQLRRAGSEPRTRSGD